MTDTNEYASMLQNIKVSADLGRKELFELPRRGPYHRYVNFPVEVRCEIEPICVCSTQALMAKGCTCGQMERERNASQPTV